MKNLDPNDLGSRSKRESTSAIDPVREAEQRRFLRQTSVYAIATRSKSPRALEDQVARLVRGGVLAVQLREKGLPDAEVVALARSLRAVLEPLHVPLILNDRVDLVAETGASGVHLGQGDMPLEEARRLLGPKAIIGGTAHSLEDAIDAERAGADYIGAGPIFESRTKQVRPPRGVEWLSSMAERIAVPVFAIGGIRIEHVAVVAAAGAHGVAVCEALLSVDDPESAARAMCEALRARRAL